MTNPTLIPFPCILLSYSVRLWRYTPTHWYVTAVQKVPESEAPRHALWSHRPRRRWHHPTRTVQPRESKRKLLPRARKMQIRIMALSKSDLNRSGESR